MNVNFSIADLLKLVRIFCPSISVRIVGFYGEIIIDGEVVFNTQGPASEAVISGYLSGMIKTKTLSKN